MNEDKKKAQEKVKELEHVVSALEEAHKKYVATAEKFRGRVDFTKGVTLGLIYGILGNLLVQFFYPVVESWVLGEFTIMYWLDIGISAGAFIITLYVTVEYRSQLRKDKGWMNTYTMIHEVNNFINRKKEGRGNFAIFVF